MTTDATLAGNFGRAQLPERGRRKRKRPAEHVGEAVFQDYDGAAIYLTEIIQSKARIPSGCAQAPRRDL